MQRLILSIAVYFSLAVSALAQVCPAGSTCATLDSYLGAHLALGGALTTTGTGAATFALGNSTATYTFQGTDTYVGRATTDTLTNKTLTSPTINGATLSGTLSGNPTFSGSAPLFTGLSAGTQVSCVGLDSGNHLVLNAAACGSGGGGSGTVTSISAGNGISTGGSPITTTGTISSTNTTRTVSGATYTLDSISTDAGISILMTNGSATTITLISSATAGANYAVLIVCDAGCTINRAGSDTINGATSLVLAAKQSTFLQADAGTAWRASVFAALDPSNATNLSAGTVAAARLPADVALLDATGQTYTGGIHPTAFSNGTASSGTKTIDCGNGPIQSLTNGGAFTLAMSANDGSCVVRVTNNGTAGAITFSGFSEGSNTGDALTTTNTNIFDLALTRIGGNPHYLVSALQ